MEEKTEAIDARKTISRNLQRRSSGYFDALNDLMTPAASPKQPIGFVPLEDKSKK
ncbi:MAG: hypothetical protein V9E91_08770 [Burkholderiaceae bacterium]